MFLYLPYGTDAPIYYRPIVTIAMIVINVLVFFMFTAEQIEPYMLAVGAGLHPIQWLTTNFLHADIFHLGFNMLFLWVFGLVIEGKLGSFKMLMVYLVIGINFGAIIQIMMLGQEPSYCLGASAIIFGLAVMAFLWAPENRINALFIVWFGFFFRYIHLDLKISILVGIFLVLDSVTLVITGGALSSALLHLVGAAMGLIVGIVMRKMNLVDCEHRDIVSVWKGEHNLTDKERAALENKPATLTPAEEIEFALANKKSIRAYIIAQQKERAKWTLSQELHLKMIQQLFADKHWETATISIRQYLERHTMQSPDVRIMLAQALLAQNKPKSAIRALKHILIQGSETELQSAIPKIQAEAEAMHQKNMDEGIDESVE